jgi:PhnB protein
MYPYLSFNANCKEAFEFYAKCLGGRISFMMTYGESPVAEQTAPEQLGNIMHISMEYKGLTLAGADAPPQYFSRPAGFSVALTPDSAEEAERIFAAMSEGGTVRMPLQSTFWAQRFGMFIDRFDIPWMINCGQPTA